jgi:uncharacterized protein YndB with AHSA1/START domain
MTGIPEVVRKIEIAARRETVFRYFTDPARFAAWWGEGSSVDPRPGGRVVIRYPNGERASGVFREIVPPARVVFTFGGEGPSSPVPPGGSTVRVTLEETPRGTLLTLRHADFPSPEAARPFAQGWRYQLSVFSRVVAAEQNPRAAAAADAWFAAWNEDDPERRRALLAESAAPDVAFWDDHGALAGHEDLDAQIAATKMYMPGLRLERSGEPAFSHHHALVRWEARDAAGAVKGKGVNAMTFGPDGRLVRVVGFWGV